MSNLTAYELQANAGGKWEIKAIFDDKETALREASRLEETRNYSAIRVVEEKFDGAANATVTRTIFRGSAAGDRNKEVVERRAQVRHDAQAARSKPRISGKTTVGKVAVAGSETSVSAAILILIGVVALGAGALFALKHYIGGVQ